MKHLILIGDGMADLPSQDPPRPTPLELAFTPSMDEVALSGVSGLFCPIPDDFPPGSDVGNLSLFGYDPHDTYTGRAPLEAASQGIALASHEIAFRCNLVTLQHGLMRDFTADHITTEEARELISALNTHLTAYPVLFSPGVSYRHLTILAAPADLLNAPASLQCTPPHDITGTPYAQHLPTGPAAQLLCDLTTASQPLLTAHPANTARVAAGKLPANSIWLWGHGRYPTIKTYPELFGIRGAVISAVDLVKGIGVCAGLEPLTVPGATGYLDTNYHGKITAALEALRTLDFVYVHVEAPDEASHEGRLDLKVRAIEDFDAHIVAPALRHVRDYRNTRLFVAPDHATPLSTRTHAGGPVPFAACGAGITPNAATAFTERAAHDTGILISQGHTLMPYFLRTEDIAFPS